MPVGSHQATKVGGKSTAPQGMLILLFRKKNKKIVRKTDISQHQYAQNFLIQKEGVIGIYLEAKPYGNYFFICVLAWAGTV